MGKLRPGALVLAASLWLLVKAAGAAASCTAGKLLALGLLLGKPFGQQHGEGRWQGEGGALAAAAARRHRG